MPVFDFIVLALAARACLDAWFEGSLFADWRARAEVWDNWLGVLLGCRFCLAYHMPWLVLAAAYVPGLWLEAPWQLLSRLPLYSLAITTLLHALAAAWRHTGHQE
jgi:hypothetical protein